MSILGSIPRVLDIMGLNHVMTFITAVYISLAPVTVSLEKLLYLTLRQIAEVRHTREF
jgi:hypothetical protein